MLERSACVAKILLSCPLLYEGAFLYTSSPPHTEKPPTFPFKTTLHRNAHAPKRELKAMRVSGTPRSHSYKQAPWKGRAPEWHVGCVRECSDGECACG